mmetsp:Transcript_43064/g.119784  ORF Transcript_43064/g.119784 Transcript_43064/m.119784 type:complete len:133 (+) Transcript_43064:207-605(+)
MPGWPHPHEPVVLSSYHVVLAHGFPLNIGGHPEHREATGTSGLPQRAPAPSTDMLVARISSPVLFPYAALPARVEAVLFADARRPAVASACPDASPAMATGNTPTKLAYAIARATAIPARLVAKEVGQVRAN